MKTYKLFRIRDGDLFPLYVEHRRKIETGVWLDAHIGTLADETHVRGRTSILSLRPGWHSTEIPFTDWIGKRMPDGTLAQKLDTIWCECEVKGKQIETVDRNGLRTIPDGWYYFRTNSRQERPWIISNKIKVNRKLTHEEVVEICAGFGIVAQKLATS